MRQIDHRFDDQPAVGAGDHVGQEKAVNLELGEGQLAKLHQRRITRPEIVDRQPDALDPKPRQRVHQLDQRLGRALGQFEHQPFGRHVERAAQSFDQVGKIELVEAYRRNVERKADVDPRGMPFAPLAKRTAQPPLGQRVDQPMALGQRHEA